ncbi:ThiF family adenylyltransferase [Cognatilysobacter terrigena]|uniref:ThiF family adenylyltransferase n=1 Tax=Cognatilysobacter terrigena TaxID=2488749 RepID=UPI00105FA610|nr:ThiF family adenylyltransferase [Lysobacter terrigena]
MSAVGLRMTHGQHARLLEHLHPGDGQEAAAWLLCGRRAGADRHVLCVRDVFPIDHAATDRGAAHVTWHTSSLAPVFAAAAQLDTPAIVHVHSHPAGAERFSRVDDEADAALHEDLAKVYNDGLPTASLILLPDGRMRGRSFVDGQATPLERICVVGERITIVSEFDDAVTDRAFLASQRQAFGDGTRDRLRPLRIAIVGCSGTGSVVVELLSRLGVGELILVDPQVVEERNLNRIINSSVADVAAGRSKVRALADAVTRNLGDCAPRFQCIAGTLQDAWPVVATADIVFGCTDSAEARMHLDLLCHHYTLPYFDVGVDISADGHGGVRYVGAAVHYLQPGGDSLLARKGYRMSTVEAEALRRESPERYAEQRRVGYIEHVEEDRPAVISLNTFAASMAVNELLARVHGFRGDSDTAFAARRVHLREEYTRFEPAGSPCPTMSPHLGRGDCTPPLGISSWQR